MRSRTVLLILLVLGAAGVRVGLLQRQGLWADEVFSLAMATGHSLEHSAQEADPASGDFVQATSPSVPSEYRRLLEHETPPATRKRVLRSVFRSDTSPPLYYLLLHFWTRLVGTGDAALRGFSLAWAMACLPLLWIIARRLGGQRGRAPTLFLFAFAPLAVYYSTEGRMYSMLWFVTLSAAWTTLELRRRGRGLRRIGWWVLASSAGLFTHYFFFFAWVAMALWAGWKAERTRRLMVLAGALLTAVIVSPWYLRIPESLAAYRITSGWLELEPAGYSLLKTFFHQGLCYFSGYGSWGGSWRIDQLLKLGFVVFLSILFLRDRTRAFRGGRSILWLWLIASMLGPLAFDFVRGTYVFSYSRFVLPGLPAAFLLAGAGIGRLPGLLRGVVLVAIFTAWLVGLGTMYRNPSRCKEPMREVARQLDLQATEADLIIVHSIPSGVLGVARYMSEEVPMVDWVGQLGERGVPDSLMDLARGFERVFVVEVHAVGEPVPEKAYLEEHAELQMVWEEEKARVSTFVPRGATVFFADRDRSTGK